MRISKFAKFIPPFLLGSALLSVATHLVPGIVSTPVDDYIKDNDMPAAYLDLFHVKNTRIYHRYNPLYPFHLGGLGTRIVIEEAKELDRPADKAVAYGLSVPAGYYLAFDRMFSTFIPPYHSIDAFSIKNTGSLNERAHFVRPPGAIDMDDTIEAFTKFDDVSYQSKTDPKTLAQLFKEYVFLHELRHGDQDRKAHDLSNEGDADVYALKALAYAHPDKKEAVKEINDLTYNLRVINGAKGGFVHATSDIIAHGETSYLSAAVEQRSMSNLHYILNDFVEHNKKELSSIDTKIEKRYHVAKAIAGMPDIPALPHLKRLANEFTQSVEFFNARNAKPLLQEPEKYKTLDLEAMKKTYIPAPNLIPTS